MWSGDVITRYSNPTWDTWNNDPTKLAVLRSVASCHARLGHGSDFGYDIVNALAQQYVCAFHFIGHGGSGFINSFQVNFHFGSTSLLPLWYPEFGRSPGSNRPEQPGCTNSISWTLSCFVYCCACKWSFTVLTARVAWSSRFGDANMGNLNTTDFLNCTSRLSVTGLLLRDKGRLAKANQQFIHWSLISSYCWWACKDGA